MLNFSDYVNHKRSGFPHEDNFWDLEKARDEEGARLKALFKKDALDSLGLTDHPKADLAFEIAWEDRNSEKACGSWDIDYRPVYEQLCKLARLL